MSCNNKINLCITGCLYTYLYINIILSTISFKPTFTYIGKSSGEEGVYRVHPPYYYFFFFIYIPIVKYKQQPVVHTCKY